MGIKLFADGADLASIAVLANDSRIDGFTTNPSLCRKAGVTDYRYFAKQAIAIIGNKPVSFEVFADDIEVMEHQAREIASWGNNIYVKVPITNTKGELTIEAIESLVAHGVKVNVTAVFTEKQIYLALRSLNDEDAIVSIFAGRIADAGHDPVKIVQYAVNRRYGETKILWASTRELLNIKQAEDCGCDIITVPNDLLKKMHLIGKDLTEYSLETVQMFHDDAKASGFSL